MHKIRVNRPLFWCKLLQLTDICGYKVMQQIIYDMK